jgi:protein-S-isoprenylcysteine O-methyltransferase Ste14
MKPQHRRLSADLGDLCARAITGSLFLALAWRLGRDFAQTGRATDLLLLVGEGLVVVLTLLRRNASMVDRRAIVRVVTGASMASPFLVRPGPVGGLLPETAAAMIAVVGLAIVVAGKLSLGYSFGLLPAHRGLVDGGVYRIVRHPIYLGYLITHGSFLLSHPTLWNLIALGGGDLALLARACYEEQILARDAAYARYCANVKWRLLPGVY